MAFLPRARERVRPWPVRALVVLALGAVLPLPPADAKKDHGLKLPAVPSLPSPTAPAPAGQALNPGKQLKVKAPKAPKLPKLPKPGKKGPPLEAPSPVATPPSTSIVQKPIAAVAEPGPASAPTPAAATPAPAGPARPAAPSRRSARTRTRRSSPHRAARHRSARRRADRSHHRAARHASIVRHGAHASAAVAPDQAPARKPRPRHAQARHSDQGSAVTRTVREIVEVVPGSVKAALAALACLSAVLGGGYLFSLLRAGRLDRQRGQLLQEVGLLQGALLPPVPETLGAVRPSVAYRPADGPGAGGDFYDALELPDGRAVFILGDVSGHGREALERTAFVRYTLRAFAEAGLAPREALQVAGRVVGEHLGGEFVTVLLAVHDPLTGSLTWASAGHPAPIVRGTDHFEPVTAGCSPPIGMGLESGFRQTTVPLPAGSMACMYTDGLIEARTAGEFLGRRGLEEILGELGDEATATALIELVVARTRTATDDMAACLLSPAGEVDVSPLRREEILVSVEDLDSGLARRFLAACGVGRVSASEALAEASEVADAADGAVLAVNFDHRRSVEVFAREPLDEHGITAASRRVVAH